MKRLNLRFVAILIVGLILSGTAVHVLHGFQLNRHARHFLEHARQARADGEMVRAASDYERYCDLAPWDVEARAEYGLLLADLSRYDAALKTLEAVVRLDPNRLDARRCLVEIEMGIRRFSDAREHLERMLEASPGDGELWELLGACQFATEQYEAAALSLRLSVESSPDRLQAYWVLADLLRNQLKETEEADQWMCDMVASNPKSAEAQCLRGEYLRQLGDIDDALNHARRALELQRDDLNALLLASQCAAENEDLEAARDYLSQAVDAHPEKAGLYARLAELELAENRPDEAAMWLRRGVDAAEQHAQLTWSLARLYAERGDFEQAEQTLAKLPSAQQTTPQARYLQARVACLKGRWSAGREQLEDLRATLVNSTGLTTEVNFWLAKCCEQLGDTEESLASYRTAIAADPFFLPARTDLANALMRAGQIDEALEISRQMTKLEGASAKGWLLVATCLTLRNQRLQPDQRDWDEANRILDAMTRANPNSSSVAILQAEALASQGQMDQADSLLASFRSRDPAQWETWIAAIRFARHQGDWDKARQLIEEAHRVLGDCVPLRVARAQCLRQRDGNEAASRIAELAEGADEFSEADRTKLWAELAIVSLRAENSQQAWEFARKVADARPGELEIRRLLFDIAVQAEDEPKLTVALEEIRRIEGAGPLWHYGQAVRLRLFHDPQKSAWLDQARDHLAEARYARPAWPRLRRLAGELHELEGNNEAALKAYQEAVDLGDRNPMLLRRVVSLMSAQGRFAEADRLMRQFGAVGGGRALDLERVASELALRQEDFTRALRSAERTARQSGLPADYMWLGQVLLVVASRAHVLGHDRHADDIFRQAQAAFQKARELDPKNAAPWVALVQTLARSGRTTEAERTLAKARLKIDDQRAPLALAQCYEAVGRFGEAEAQYRQALRAEPGNPRLQRLVVDFYLRSDQTDKAEAVLRAPITVGQESDREYRAWVRRKLALILAVRGHAGRQEALELIDENISLAPDFPGDQLVRARILAICPDSDSRQQAITLFTELHQRRITLDPDDQFTLARLYLAKDRWPEFLAVMRRLLASHGHRADYVHAYVDSLIDRAELSDAELWLGRLEETAPEHPNTVSLRVRLLVTRKEYSAALSMLQALADRAAAETPPQPKRLIAVARSMEAQAALLEQAGDHVEAEAFAQSAESLFRSQGSLAPAQRLEVAAFLARRGRLDEALTQLEQEWQSASLDAIARVAGSVFTAEPEAADLARLEKTLADVLRQHGRQGLLLFVLADLRIQMGDYDGARMIYEEILARNDRSVAAMNNLAVLLALQGKDLDAALQLINRALENVGPLPTLLDSRAIVYLAVGKPKKALADVKRAIDGKAKAIWHFHRAQARYQLGERIAAGKALDDALALGLTATELHPLERPALARLRKEFY